jgi:hypothetical protein
MKLFASVALLALSSCMSVPGSQSSSAGSQPAASPEHQFTVYLGQRSLDEDDWSPVEDQGALQLEYASESPDAAVGWEVGLGGSSDDDTFGGFDVTGSTAELYGGVRKTFGSGTVRPYVGGGLSFINAEVEVGSASEDDSSVAMYLHGGVQFLLGDSFALGLDLRALLGSDITIAGVDGDADYGQAALTLGWRF